MKKTCTSCHKKLPLSEFWKEGKGLYGVKSKCNTCCYQYREKQKYKDHRKYVEGDCVKIYFCKMCGKLLPLEWPGKNVIRRYLTQPLKSIYFSGLCEKCEAKADAMASEVAYRYRIEKIKKDALSVKRKAIINRIRKKRRDWKLCPVCGQAINVLMGENEYLPDYFPGCSKECLEKINYVKSVRNTGIKGVNARAFYIFPPRANTDDWELCHGMYQTLKLAKEYVEFKKKRIELNKTIEELN